MAVQVLNGVRVNRNTTNGSILIGVVFSGNVVFVSCMLLRPLVVPS